MRAPDQRDGGAMWRFVREFGGLELNTGYAYVIFGAHFTDTSIVAYDRDGDLAGFVLGYRPPTHPDALFVWQVGVSPKHRGQGIARRLLLSMLERDVLKDVHYLEATVTPSNAASQRLFRSVARQLGTSCEEKPFLGADLFGEDGHEAEDLFRIGPF